MQGIDVNKEEINGPYTDFYKRRGSTIKYIICNMNDERTKCQILSQLMVADAPTWETMKAALNPDQFYYVFFTVNYEKDDLKKEDKCVFMYSPDSGQTADKMVYAQNFNTFFKAYNPTMTNF